MTAPRCARCGDPFELREPHDTRCSRCDREVTALIAADTARRACRRWSPAETTPWLPGRERNAA